MPELDSKPAILVIDDDLPLVEDLRRKVEASGLIMVAPPEIGTDALEAKKNLDGKSVLILDLNLRGWLDEGLKLLRRIAGDLRIPVIIWSKYLLTTTLFEGEQTKIWEDNKALLVKDGQWVIGTPPGDDALKIREVREAYAATRAFVSKLERDPIELLFLVLKHELHAAGQTLDGTPAAQGD
jgi:CheY-like chemotaxis protein